MLRHLLHRSISAFIRWHPPRLPASLYTRAPLSQMDLDSIVARLEQVAPTNTAETWDNVGLLLEPCRNPTIERIFLTNDLTEEVLQEAVGLPGKKVGLIISYHPPIFTPIRRLTQASAKERIILQCVASQMAVYSPHTALDRQINTWLVQGLGSGVTTSLPCATNATDPNEGIGRLSTLTTPVALSTIVSRVKSYLRLPYVRLAMREGAGSADPLVSSIAAAAGSGGSVLQGVEADVYLTGEMSHHTVLEATARGVSVILTEHSNSERQYLWEEYKRLVEGAEGQVEVTLSQVDKDPLQIV